MNLKVIEFASVLAGPAVGMFFAELGAEVIKVENKKTGGDMTRGWKNPNEDPASPVSAYWSSVNYGKRYLMLDLDHADDRKMAQELCLEADVVICNFKPSAAKRFDLDPALLMGRNPKLIYAQLNAYPDPEDNRPAFDVVLQAETGFMSMTGEPGQPPVKMPVALIDLLAAHQMKEAILLALWEREKTGKGKYVVTSLFESAVASLANQASNWLMGGFLPAPMGSRHPNIAPYGDQFVCADDKILVLAVGTERHFTRLCELMGLNHLSSDTRFKSNPARVKNRAALNAVLQDKFSQCSADEWLQACYKRGVPAAPVRNLEELFALPETQQMILESEEENVKTRRVKTVAFGS